jgi:hypothetical protein
MKCKQGTGMLVAGRQGTGHRNASCGKAGHRAQECWLRQGSFSSVVRQQYGVPCRDHELSYNHTHG